MKRYIVITGASSGIGLATAKAFAKRNKNLILIARSETKLNELKKSILTEFPQLDIIVNPFDLTQTNKLSELFSDLDKYFIEVWINNAGFGMYSLVKEQNLDKTQELLKLNVEALAMLSTLYVEKYHNEKDTQLINISSAGGYVMVPMAVTYCASKYFVSAFTEALALELREQKAELVVKVLAPAATKTNFGKIANNVDEYDYDSVFGTYHSSEEIANFLLELYDSDKIVGHVDRGTFKVQLTDNLFTYANNPANNQRL